jgi:hypothetical protein
MLSMVVSTRALAINAIYAKQALKRSAITAPSIFDFHRCKYQVFEVLEGF